MTEIHPAQQLAVAENAALVQREQEQREAALAERQNGGAR
jgi:hypothetical protein